jgi:hypothetical protein
MAWKVGAMDAGMVAENSGRARFITPTWRFGSGSQPAQGYLARAASPIYRAARTRGLTSLANSRTSSSLRPGGSCGVGPPRSGDAAEITVIDSGAPVERETWPVTPCTGRNTSRKRRIRSLRTLMNAIIMLSPERKVPGG